MRVASLVHFPIDQKFVLSNIRIPPQTTNLDKMLDSRTTRSATKTSCNSDFTDFHSTHKNHQRCGSHCLFSQKNKQKTPKVHHSIQAMGRPGRRLPRHQRDLRRRSTPSVFAPSRGSCDTSLRYAAMPLCRYATHAVARWRNHHPLGMENSP